MSAFCRLLAGAVVCFVVGGLAVGCSAQEVVTTVRLTSAATTVRADYDRAHQALERRIAGLPELDATQWRTFIRDADAYKAALEAMWGSVVTSQETAAALYETGVELYARALALVGPDLKTFPLADQILLRQMDSAVRRLAEAYQQWTANPDAAQRSEMVETGVEIVKLALQLGVAAL